MITLFIRNFCGNFQLFPLRVLCTMCENLSTTQKIKEISENVKSHPDFPRKGVLFRDMFSVLADARLFKTLNDIVLSHAKSIQPPIENIVAIDSKGFIYGSLLARGLNIGLIPIRKKGKLPGEVVSIDYELEYGTDTIQMQKDALKKCSRVMIVDDLLATGGTLQAAGTLVESLGAKVIECLVIVEILRLKGRSKVQFPVRSFLEFH